MTDQTVITSNAFINSLIHRNPKQDVKKDRFDKKIFYFAIQQTFHFFILSVNI